MKTSLILIIVILVLAVFGGIFYGGYHAVDYLWGLYASLDAVIRIVLLSSMAALLAGSLIIARAVRASAQAVSKDRMMEAKLDLYRSLLGLYEQYFDSPQQEKTEIVSKLARLESDVMILASNSVLNIHGKLKSALNSYEDEKKLAELLQQLIKSIRRDLGNGAIYDDSRLKYLLTPGQVDNKDSTSTGVTIN